MEKQHFKLSTKNLHFCVWQNGNCKNEKKFNATKLQALLEGLLYKIKNAIKQTLEITIYILLFSPFGHAVNLKSCNKML